MKSILSNLIIFAAGAAIGSAVANKLLKEKYERIADEEIESMREFFSRRKEECEKNVADEEEESDDQMYTRLSRDYASQSAVSENGKEEQLLKRPYVISPDVFGEDLDYETRSLTYYSDGVLTDEMDEVIEDVDGLVGADFSNHFGDYEDDSVFIRDDEKRCDYEILRDSRPYSGR